MLPDDVLGVWAAYIGPVSGRDSPHLGSHLDHITPVRVAHLLGWYRLGHDVAAKQFGTAADEAAVDLD